MPHELFYFLFLRFQTGANRLKIKFCTKKLNSFFLKNWVWYLEKQSTGLTDLGSPMAESFFYVDLFSMISAIFRG